MSRDRSYQSHFINPIFAGLFGLCILSAIGEVRADQIQRPFSQLSQAGIRLGAWANLGDAPTKSATDGTTSYETDFNGGVLYFEGYVALRFAPVILAELSLGLFNRGDVSVKDGTDEFFGNLLVYPLLLRAKFYPFGNSHMRLQPYVSGGGGFYYARHSIQYYRSNAIFTSFGEASATSFELTAGGGVDLQVARQIAVELSGSYLPLNFSKNLITIRNYDGLGITLGVKYLFSARK